VDDAAALALLASLAATGGGQLTYESLKKGLRDAVANDPFDANVVVVAGGAFLFYLAEKGHNPKVTSYWDALVFVSTCMSVGYADIFARTPAGQAIASAVMAIGPALSGALLEAPRGANAERTESENAERTESENAERTESETEKTVAVQRILVEKLDAILEELRAARGRP
jgi:hypothetical protein